MNKTLYKYRDDSNNTEKIFLDQKVWLSNASGLNDPFECTIQEIAQDYIDKNVKEMMEAHIMGFVDSISKNYDPTKKTVLKRIKKASLLTKKHKILREAYLKYSGIKLTNPIDTFKNFDKQLQKAGIFSMSEDPLNELMWAHYADESKGIAIGFSVKDNSLLSNNDKCLRVNYSDQLPKFDSDGFLTETSFFLNGVNKQQIAFNDPTLKKAISTKSPSWAYEKEWRYVEPKCGAYPFPSNICSIIFGLKTTKDTIKKYISLAKSLNNHSEISFYKVQNIFNTNKLELKQIYIT